MGRSDRRGSGPVMNGRQWHGGAPGHAGTGWSAPDRAAWTGELAFGCQTGEVMPEPLRPGLRQWTVAAALIEAEGGLLLVQNRRRNGMTDWSTPGGVVEEHEETVDGLAREVVEETGIVVRRWRGPVYEVETIAVDLGWHLRVQVYEALDWHGELVIDDPDGIVTDARFVPLEECPSTLLENAIWVREPICEWLSDRWADSRSFRYEVVGRDRPSMVVHRR